MVNQCFLPLLSAAFALFLQPGEARAANCHVATAQGATGPANWQTYCWLDFTGTSARSAADERLDLSGDCRRGHARARSICYL